MKKTTKEYAEKLADSYIRKNYVDWAWEDPSTQNSKDAYREGYMKAIEENAVPELIEALEEVTEALRYIEFENGDHGEDTEMFKKAKAALKKATS